MTVETNRPGSPTAAPDWTRRDAAPRTSIRARLTARLHAGRFDRMLSGGHAWTGRQRTRRSRAATDLSRGTRNHRPVAAPGRAEAHQGPTAPSSRVPLHRARIVAAAELIDDVALLLQSADPVSARGVARVRQLLSDGRGPLYRDGHGDLAGRMGAALAAM